VSHRHVFTKTLWGLLSGSLIDANSVQAAIWCVNSPSELQSALSNAGISVESDDIRLQTGTYSLLGPAFYAPAMSKATVVSGGWGPQCALQAADNSLTQLDGRLNGQVFGMNAVAGSFADLTLSNLTFKNGYSTTSGACIFLSTSGIVRLQSVHVTQCMLDGSLNYGGGIYVDRAAQIELSDDVIDGNKAPAGAAIMVAAANDLVFRNTRIEGNEVTAVGGAIVQYSGFGGTNPTLEVSTSRFAGNSGLALYGGGPSVEIEGSTFLGNTRADPGTQEECGILGAGDANQPKSGSITISGSSFTGSGQPGGSCLQLSAASSASSGEPGSISITGSSFTGFTNGVLPMLSSRATTLARDYFADNTGYAAVESWSPSLHITQTKFVRNAGSTFPGAVLANAFVGTIAIDNSLFDGNHSDASGGAVNISLGCQGGICDSDTTATVTFTNNTFVNNQSGGDGGAIALSSAFDQSPVVALWNNLLWNDEATGRGPDVYFNNDSDGDFSPTPITLASNAYAASGIDIRVPEVPLVGGDLNITDPQFDSGGNGDYRLSASSPLVDSGSASAPSLGHDDIAGLPRTSGAGPDIGAHETNADEIFRSHFEL